MDLSFPSYTCVHFDPCEAQAIHSRLNHDIISDLNEMDAEDIKAYLSNITSNLGTCPFCQKTFKKLKQHVKMIHLNKPQQCMKCRKILSNEGTFKRHRYVKISQ